MRLNLGNIYDDYFEYEIITKCPQKNRTEMESM